MNIRKTAHSHAEWKLHTLVRLLARNHTAEIQPWPEVVREVLHGWQAEEQIEATKRLQASQEIIQLTNGAKKQAQLELKQKQIHTLAFQKSKQTGTTFTTAKAGVRTCLVRCMEEVLPDHEAKRKKEYDFTAQK